MQIVHVIPIARGVGAETLSYFTNQEVRPGHVVSVPLRKRVVPALVVHTEKASDAKEALRHAAYSLRKTTTKKPWQFLSPACMEAVFETASWHASTKGAALHSIVPTFLWDSSVAEKLSPHTDISTKDKDNTVPERFIIQVEEEERVSRYRGLVRESFARGHSMFICVPTIVEGERIKEKLERGIGKYIFLLHSTLPKKELLKNWEQALSEEHPVVIIGTPPFLTLSRKDLATIIIERENGSSYKQQTRPYIDLRRFVESYAKARRIRLILGGLPLRVETMWRHEQHELETLVPPKLHPRSEVEKIVVDLREQHQKNDVPQKKRVFKVLGSELVEHIQSTLEKKERVFLFSPRRGLSPLTVCSDCGTVVTCENSNEPVVLYKGLEKNVFVCQSTGAVRSAEERCMNCNSWRLQSLGIGSERIEASIREQFEDAPVTVFTSDTVSTHKQALSVIEEFNKTRGGILIGTEKVLPYLWESISLVAIASADSLLSHPEWRMSEKAFSLLLELRDKAANTFLIQTRRPEERIIRHALQGDTSGFYRDERSSRELLRYPPYSVLIKISSVGTPAKVKTRMEEIEQIFSEYKLRVYLPTVRVETGRFVMHGLLRVPRDSWPDEKLLTLLSSLPQHFGVHIDPDRLLNA